MMTNLPPEPDAQGLLSEQAEVVAVAADGIWVAARQRTACGACAARQGCGQGLLERLLARPARLFVPHAGSADTVQVGAQVRLGLPAGAVVRAALVLYLVPVLGLLAAALLARGLGHGDGVQAAAAVAGLAAGFLAAGALQRLVVPDVLPRLLAVLPAGTVPVQVQGVPDRPA